MIKYELIPHTADIRLKIEGTTQEELFKAALQGMASILKKGKNLEAPTQTKKIDLKAPDQTTLIVDFLSDVLTTSYTHYAIFDEIEFIQLSTTKLSAIIKGIKVINFDKDIKAVTYHEANVLKNKNSNLETIIVFDI